MPKKLPPRPPASERRHWLFKTEPGTFSFDDLWNAPGRRTGWDGIRNHQVRNFLRDDVRPGDLVVVYHSSAEPSGVAGFAEVVAGAAPDPTQFDPRSEHFDPKSTRAAPTWLQVEVRALERAPRFVPLPALRAIPELAGMALLRRGQRLSVLPLTPAEWGRIRVEAGLEAGDPSVRLAKRTRERRPGPKS